MLAVNWSDIEPVPGARNWSPEEWAKYHSQRRKRLSTHVVITKPAPPPIPIPIPPAGRRIYDAPIGPVRWLFVSPIIEVDRSGHPVKDWQATDLGPHVPEDARIPFSVLLEWICATYNITPVSLFAHRRKLTLVTPRHHLWFLARRHTTMSLPEIARRSGGFDHTTLISGIRKFDMLLSEGRAELWGRTVVTYDGQHRRSDGRYQGAVA